MSRVRRLNGGADPQRAPSSACSFELPDNVPKRGERGSPSAGSDKTLRQLLSRLEGGSPRDLDDQLLRASEELERSGIELLHSDSERIVRSIDASEPPSLVSGFLLSGPPALVVKPRDHDQVRRCVETARRNALPVVVRGAASSAFGAVLPPSDGIVIDLTEMQGVLSLEPAKQEVTVLAGTRWADLSLELEKSGLALISSPSSLFSTVGGWFSTGGFGLNSHSAGHMSRHVRGVRVVYPDGSDARLSPDDEMFGMLVGTEGQLGAITELTLSVRRTPRFSRTVVIQTSDDARAARVVDQLLRTRRPVTHIMLFDETRSREINRTTPIPGSPLHDTPAILIQLEGDDPDSIRPSLPSDISWSDAPEFMANLLWGNRYFPMRGRKSGPGMLGAEVVVPPSLLPRYLHRVRRLGKMFGLEIASDAHILSDSEALVLSFFLTDQRDVLMYSIHSVLSMLITRIGIEFGGRPYAVGLWNLPFTSFVFGRERIRGLRDKKRALDPEDLFNPGKFLSARSKFSAPLRALLRERLVLVILGGLLAAAGAAGRIARGLRPRKGGGELSPLELSTYACARCGACVGVCPAYMVTGRETVTGRGKLLLARDIMNGIISDQVAAEEMFLCIRCRACEEVCQTNLPLLAAYEELEETLQGMIGRPKQLIERFVAEVEASPEYERLVYEGIISPDAGLKEGRPTDAV